MNNEIKKSGSSSLPLVIIGLVLLAAIAGGFWFYQNSKTGTNVKSNANKPTATPVTSNVPGAQPPNFLGSPTASVVVEEFADYQCPTCGATYPKLKEIESIYGSRIKFVFRNFPLPMHQHGYEAAVAAEAAGLQGKFWEMQNQLFTNQTAWAREADVRATFKDYAQKIGLDVDKFENDSLGLAAKQRVDADLERGRALKVGGTPTIYINGKELNMQQFEVSAMRQVIDAELQKAQGGNSQPAPAQATNAANSAVNSNDGK